LLLKGLAPETKKTHVTENIFHLFVDRHANSTIPCLRNALVFEQPLEPAVKEKLPVSANPEQVNPAVHRLDLHQAQNWQLVSLKTEHFLLKLNRKLFIG
jgi:hypothetical protein